MALTEHGRLATRLATSAGARYFHPYYDTGENVIERSGHIDEYGHLIVTPHTDIEFASSNSGAATAELTYDTIHGDVLKCLTTGGLGIDFDNLDQPGGGQGSWDQFRPPSSATAEHIVAPGLYINPADGDISAGNMSTHTY